MKKKIYIELLEKTNIFRIPDGYFDELSVSINQKITFEKFGKKSTESLKVPENYFENLADRIQNRIAKEQKVQITLDSLPKVNVFKVKDGYFEKLPSAIQSAISPKQKPPFKVSWSLQRTFAAAASILLVVSAGWYFLTNTTSQNNNVALKGISKQEIVSYLQNQDLTEEDFSEVVKMSKNQADSLTIQHLNLSKEDIENHLKNENVEEEI